MLGSYQFSSLPKACVLLLNHQLQLKVITFISLLEKQYYCCIQFAWSALCILLYLKQKPEMTQLLFCANSWKYTLESITPFSYHQVCTIYKPAEGKEIQEEDNDMTELPLNPQTDKRQYTQHIHTIFIVC